MPRDRPRQSRPEKAGARSVGQKMVRDKVGNQPGVLYRDSQNL